MPEFDSTIEYRDIDGFPGYMVGNDGSVWSCRPKNGVGPLRPDWRRLAPLYDGAGRPFVKLCPGVKIRKICRLVLEAFAGACPPQMECCHYPDHDPANCHLHNIRWDTKKANAQDCIKHGRRPRGEKAGRAKLTEIHIKEIRDQYAAGTRTYKSLSKTHHVSPALIRSIVKRTIWKHIA